MTFSPNPDAVRTANDAPDAVTFTLGDAVRTVSAVGDAVVGTELGFGLRVGALATAIARRLKLEEPAIDAIGYAGMWHHIGHTGLPLDSPFIDRSARAKEIAAWEAPLAGAAISRATPAIPAAVADAIRWHREAWDGTGFPDRLRWNGIPQAASIVGVARAFLAGTASRVEPREPDEVLYELMNSAGRAYSVGLLRAFRETVMFEPDACAPGAEPALPPLYGNAESARALFARVAHTIDGRDATTIGRTERMGRSIAATANALGYDRAFIERATMLATFVTFGDLAKIAVRDELDPLARMARERRAPEIALAQRIAKRTTTYAPYAPMLADVYEWFDTKRELAIEARLVAVASAYDILSRVIASTSTAASKTLDERIYAAAGTQFDPAIASAFVTELRR